MERLMSRALSFFSLFGSLSTLLCCALPVTLVTLGMGATFASLIANVPQILWLTQHKDVIFVMTAIFLFLSFIALRKSQDLPCPVDIKKREVCQKSRKAGTWLYWSTVVMYLIGFSFSYVVPYLIYKELL